VEVVDDLEGLPVLLHLLLNGEAELLGLLPQSLEGSDEDGRDFLLLVLSDLSSNSFSFLRSRVGRTKMSTKKEPKTMKGPRKMETMMFLPF
jgi:hypothetical protein